MLHVTTYSYICRRGRNRTHTSGFGDRCSTIELHTYTRGRSYPIKLPTRVEWDETRTHITSLEPLIGFEPIQPPYESDILPVKL